jgi:hypothetical protein
MGMAKDALLSRVEVAYTHAEARTTATICSV